MSAVIEDYTDSNFVRDELEVLGLLSEVGQRVTHGVDKLHCDMHICCTPDNDGIGLLSGLPVDGDVGYVGFYTVQTRISAQRSYVCEDCYDWLFDFATAYIKAQRSARKSRGSTT
jgi:hypothetical protein